MRKKSIILLFSLFFLIFSVGLQSSDVLSVQSFTTTDVNNDLTAAASWYYMTVISDDATVWNDGDGAFPDIAIDGDGNIHVVWYDNTNGTWGTDEEIMYVKNTTLGWSNATVISDDATGWNTGISVTPSIAIDGSGNLHVVWSDDTVGAWGGGGTDFEVMYAKQTGASWTNAIVISDDILGWGICHSFAPDIAIDVNGVVHTVWFDHTDGGWGIDTEIMYSNNAATDGKQETFVIIPLLDSSISLLSPLGLGIIVIIITTTLIITAIIVKKIK